MIKIDLYNILHTVLTRHNSEIAYRDEKPCDPAVTILYNDHLR